MTRKEAISILEEVKENDDSMYQYNLTYLESLDMAIEALKAEPCEDAVSRADLLDAIYDLDAAFDDNFELDYGRCYKTDLEKMAMALPSVTPKQRTGKWINNHTQCSICEWGMEDDVAGSAMMLFFPYCPNCGAKMEGVSE